MPLVSIGGYEVRFPFEPYPAQEAYMQAVLQALDSGANALLESPTGTGKTLCLLCATLAWTLAKQRAVMRHPHFDPSTGHVDADSADKFKIVYCSRTHAQLTQVIRELKRALRTKGNPSGETGAAEAASERAWSEVSMALLGSREHMCVNSEVSRLPSSHTQQSMCNHLRAEKSCRFFLGLQINKAEGCLPTNDEGDAIYDMEDLVKEGRKNGFCPYYLERDLAKSADVVFMPYNYILDAHLRKQLPFELSKGCILIVDEAHNLPSVLSASACLTLQPLELANAIQDCTRAISMQRLAAEREGADPQRELLLGEEFASLKLLLARLEACVMSEGTGTEPARATGTAASARGEVTVDGEIVRPGSYMEEFLAKALITREMYEGTARSSGMSSTIDNAVAALAESEKPASGLAQAQRFLTAVFSTPIDESTRFIIKEHDGGGGGGRSHSTHPRPARGSPSPHSHEHGAPHCQERRRSLGFWRLDYSADMMELSNQTRCMLLTSGTLSPLDHFAAELGAPFPVRLRGSHVIGPGQVLGSILCRSPTGDRLNGSFASRSSVEYRVALGMTLVNISRVTPGGSLVFFPSYAALHSATDLWRAGTGSAAEGKTIWGLLSEQKPVFVEPVGSGDLAPVVAEFQKAVRESPRKGAILLAVCRGKVSEGIDFADNDGRCVMVTGIPFANHTDLFTRLKREYLTTVAPQRPRVSGKLFTGDVWYRHEAMRAVNQSIGRVIRHKDDYGAILLADERFANPSERECLSEWVASQTSVHRDFRECFPALATFFTQHTRDRRGHRRNGEMLGQNPAGLRADGVPSGTNGGAECCGSGTLSVPPSAERAKQYAQQKEQEADEAARQRQRRRLEEAEEAPVPGGTRRAVSADAEGTSPVAPRGAPPTAAGGGLSPPSPLPLSPQGPEVPRMRKQSLSDLLRNGCVATPATTAATSHSPAIFAPGSTSKEFCAFLKARVQVATYEAFKGVLKDIAQMRRGVLIMSGTSSEAAALRQKFAASVTLLHSIFAEAAPASVAELLLEFGRHIPEEFRPLYAHCVRKKS